MSTRKRLRVNSTTHSSVRRVPTAAMSFPARAVFQPGFMPEVQEELRSRHVEVIELCTQPADGKDAVRREMEMLGLDEFDMVLAIPWYVEEGLKMMGIPVPTTPDYPTCLQHLLRRRIWQSTLGQVEAELASGACPQIFIKPAEGAKGFNGSVLTGPVDGMLSGEWGMLNPEVFPLIADSGGRNSPVYCSEVLDMNSEYAVYVVDGAIRQVCHYMCKTSTCRCADGQKAAAGEPVLELDMAVVQAAICLIKESEETQALTGYRADFVLARRDDNESFVTTLCEINDGYVSGRYDACSPKDFTDMCISRFASLQSSRK